MRDTQVVICIAVMLITQGCVGKRTWTEAELERVEKRTWTEAELELVTTLDIIGPANDADPKVTAAIKRVVVDFLSSKGYRAPVPGAADVLSVEYQIKETLRGNVDLDWQFDSALFEVTLTYSNQIHGKLFSNTYRYVAETASLVEAFNVFVGELAPMLQKRHPLRLHKDSQRYY